MCGLKIRRGPLLWLRRLYFPELVVRPAVFGGLRLALNPWDRTHMVIFDEVVRDENYDLDFRLRRTYRHVFSAGAQPIPHSAASHL
jgi:hypothetical protein